MIERDWLEPYKGKDFFAKETCRAKKMAQFALDELNHAKKCGCPSCHHLAERAYEKWETEDDRINGHYHEDHEEKRLAIKVWKDMGYE